MASSSLSNLKTTMAANTTFTTIHSDMDSDSEDLISSISPLTVGLILESGVLASVLGNLLVLLSLKFQEQWVITDILLLSLSLADFIDGLFPLQLVIVMNYFAQRDWTPHLCGAFIGILNSLRFASGGTVTLIALERTFMIVSPFKYHTTITLSRVKNVVIFTWVNSAIFATLPFVGVGKSGYSNGKCDYHLSDLGKTYAILILSLSFVLLTIVLACYIAIKFSSSRFIKRQTAMHSKTQPAGGYSSPVGSPEGCSERVRQRRPSRPSGVLEVRRLSLMMAVVVILYYVSWLPILINTVVTIATNRKSKKIVVLLTGMVSLTYALANPVLYGKMSMRYRRAYKRVFASVFGACVQRPRSASTSSSCILRTPTTRKISTATETRPKEANTNTAKQPGQETERRQTIITIADQRNGVIAGSDNLADGIYFHFREEK